MTSSDLSESRRLEALAGYDIAGTPPEAAFDDLAALAKQICGTPQAYVTFFEADRVWFKAALGVDAQETPREASICALLIEVRGPLEIEDTLNDPRTCGLESVTGHGLRFYAGVPLLSPGGYVLGSFCVADTQPRQLSTPQKESLTILSRQVMAQLELRRQSAGLSATEWMARSALEVSGGAAWVVDVARGNVTGDSRLADWFNIPLRRCRDGEPIQSYLASIHEEDRALVAASMEKSSATGSAYDVEFRALGGDGVWRWFHSRGLPERDAAGKVTRMPGLILETTSRRAAETIKADSAARLRLATEAADLGIFVWHVAEDKVSWENEQVYHHFGRTPEDGPINAATFIERIVYPDDREIFQEAVATVMTGEQPFYFQGRYYRTDGVLRWIEIHGQLNRNPDGTPGWMLGTTADITARKEAEADLRRAHDTFLTLVERAPFGVYLVDAGFRLVQFSRGAHKLFKGITPLHNRDFAEILRLLWPEPLASEGIGRFRHTLETGETYVSFNTEEPAANPAEVESYDWRLERIALPEGGYGVVCYFYETTELRRTERALRASDARFRAAVRALSSLLWTNNQEGQMEGEQPGWGEFTGQTREQYEGFGWSQAVHPEDAQPTVEAWQQAVVERRMFQFEHRVRRHDGEWRMFAIRAVPVLDPNGAIQEWVGVHTDITEKRAAEALLRQSETLFREIADVAPAMMWITDISMKCTFLSRSWYEYTGMETGSGLGIGWVETVHPDDRESASQAFFTANERQQSIYFDYRIRRADGEYRWAIDAARPRFGPTGEYLGLVGNVFEIHERKMAEDALRESQARLQFALSSAEVGDWDLDLVSDIAHRSLRHDQVFGYPHGVAEWGFEKFLGHVHPEDRIWVEREFRAAAAGGREWKLECRVIWPDGTHHWIGVHGSLYHSNDGRPLRMLGIVFDITKRRQDEEALRESKERAESASRSKDNFLAALSHELRTPLTPVLMTAADLREDTSLPDHVRQELAMIERNVTLEARLIDDLLDITRISKGKLLLRKSSCDLHSLLTLAAEVVRDEAREKQIHFQWDLAAKQSLITGDPVRLQQVFWNLLRNAVKFTPGGGKVSVHSRDLPGSGGTGADSHLCVEIRDSGIGFPPEHADRLFEPFDQAGREADHRFGGLGLGLAIARAIVELHEGTIQASSEGAGLGALFTVRLPAGTAPGDTQPLQLPHSQERSVRAPEDAVFRLLLVEDHEPTLAALSRLLTRAGHAVVTAGTVADARAAAAAQTFDVVVSDLGLPDGTGLELMAHLRDTYGLRGVVLSGYGAEEDLSRSRDAGFVSHLVKPVHFTQLRQALQEFSMEPRISALIQPS